MINRCCAVDKSNTRFAHLRSGDFILEYILLHPRIPRGDSARYIVDAASGITPGYPRMILLSLKSKLLPHLLKRIYSIKLGP